MLRPTGPRAAAAGAAETGGAPLSDIDQHSFWNGEAAGKWVTLQRDFDALMQPVLDALLDRAALAPGARVLDIGCGTGQSTLQAAKLIGPSGRVTGIDISAPMLDLARDRTRDLAHVSLLEADAANHFFESRFDHAISRFGVMFFDNTTAAFTNIRKSLALNAKATFATWAPFSENPWFTLPALAAKSVLGAPPPVDPDAPGPFALREIAATCDKLKAAGFDDVDGHRMDVMLTPVGTTIDAVRFALSVGPAARCIAHFEATPAQVGHVEAALADALHGFESAEGLCIPAAINLFQATNTA